MSFTLSSFFDNTFINVIFLAIVEIYGDFELEKYAHTAQYDHLVKGTVGYLAVVYFLVKTLMSSNILYVNLMWDGTSALVETIAAMTILGERFESVEHIIGAALIIIGLVLIKMNGGTHTSAPKKRN
jgi:multidrug transporter EmrE-like cation transporter